MKHRFIHHVFFATLTLAASVAYVFTCAQPLRAATLEAKLTTTANPSNLTCPGTLSVTASAKGTPGATYSYRVQALLGGFNTLQVPWTAFTMPASGEAATTVTIAIPSDVGGGDDVELDVKPSVGLTKTATILLSCAPPPSDLAVPTGLTSISDAGDCAAHLTGEQLSKCTAALPNDPALKKFVLVWNYDQKACTTKSCATPDGYDIIYGPSSVFARQTGGAGDTAFVVDESRAKAAGTCFYVTPYRTLGKLNTDNGPSSATFCAPLDPVIVQGSNMLVAHNDFHNKETVGPAPFSFNCPSSGGNPAGQALWSTQSPYHQIDVGYIMQDNTCSRTDSVHQGIVQFDLTHLPHGTIRTATFQMHVSAAAQNSGGHLGTNGSENTTVRSCAATLGTPPGAVGTPPNWKPGDPIPGSIGFSKITSLPSVGGDGWVRVDVTDIARKWAASSGSNKGFVVAPDAPEEVLGSDFGNFDLECLSSYDGVSLKITY